MRLIASSSLSGRALGFLLLGLLTLLLEAPELSAQSPRKAFRVGFPSESSATASTATMEAFRQGLRELGYVVPTLIEGPGRARRALPPARG